MLSTKRLTIDSLNLDDQREMDAFDDQVITVGIERVRAEGNELRRRGLLNEHGTCSQRNSRDMKKDAPRDFGD